MKWSTSRAATTEIISARKLRQNNSYVSKLSLLNSMTFETKQKLENLFIKKRVRSVEKSSHGLSDVIDASAIERSDWLIDPIDISRSRLLLENAHRNQMFFRF